MKKILPIAHLNGTGKKALLDQYREAYEGLSAAIDGLAKARPHGRDYYVHADPNALKIAQEQHEAREKIARDLRDEIEALWIGLDEDKREIE